MQNLKLDYYFKDIENFSFKEVFDKCTYPWEALNRINEFINRFMNNGDMKINNAKVGEFCSIEGNYFIDEGTEMQRDEMLLLYTIVT